MPKGWKPTPDSLAAVRVTTLGSISEDAIEVFTGEFVGFFGHEPVECTDGEWNQRWQKWVQRGWKEPDKRPAAPARTVPLGSVGTGVESGLTGPGFNGPLSQQLFGRKFT
jgi:hypothetical protein